MFRKISWDHLSLGATESLGDQRGQESQGVRGLQLQGEEEVGRAGEGGEETEGVPGGLR